jgi:hypothetical protein
MHAGYLCRHFVELFLQFGTTFASFGMILPFFRDLSLLHKVNPPAKNALDAMRTDTL